ncbi:MAG: hypothetical protein FJZ86_04135 [Chloroflexi bacterium]|nr:hypothetical protein [Chloroflexota bacterium]
MTQNARLVLQDAKFAIDKHNNKLRGESFRISWFSIIGLLRAVGHVLENVDAKLSDPLNKAIKEKWDELKNTKPEPRIYWEFIKKERDRFLKNYQHGINRGIYFKLELDEMPATITIKVDTANSRGRGGVTKDEARSYIADGRYQGKNEKEIALEAYYWWKDYLDEIDEKAKEYSS